MIARAKKPDEERAPLPLDRDRLTAASDAEQVRVQNILDRDRAQAEAEAERVAMGSFQRPDAPAVVSPDMIQDRPYSEPSPTGGAPVQSPRRAYERQSPLKSAHSKGQLAGGNSDFTADQRFHAGDKYAAIWATAQSSGRDSLMALMTSRSSGRGLPIPQQQQDAIRALVSIETRMGDRDRKIVRMVCGQGYWPSEAVRTVCGDYRDTVTARFREALDALVVAIDKWQASPDFVRLKSDSDD